MARRGEELAGVHAVVTGAGTGIGAAITRALAGSGAAVTMMGRREGPLRAVAEALELATVAVGDVTDREQVKAAFDQGRAAHGPISILVNNAGRAASGPFAKFDFKAWREIMAVNVDSLHHTCQEALPDLLRADHGRIVTIASTAGMKGYAYTAAYCAAKHAAVGLTKALAAEFSRTQLTVNAVCPGFTETDLLEESLDTIVRTTGLTREAARSQLMRFNPQNRFVTAEEVASAALWLCLPQNHAITGQCLPVAGGEVA